MLNAERCRSARSSWLTDSGRAGRSHLGTRSREECGVRPSLRSEGYERVAPSNPRCKMGTVSKRTNPPLCAHANEHDAPLKPPSSSRWLHP